MYICIHTYICMYVCIMHLHGRKFANLIAWSHMYIICFKSPSNVPPANQTQSGIDIPIAKLGDDGTILFFF